MSPEPDASPGAAIDCTGRSMQGVSGILHAYIAVLSISQAHEKGVQEEFVSQNSYGL